MAYTLDEKNSASNRYVCAVCIGDDVLQAEIMSINLSHTCTYCGNSRLAVSIESLAERVDGIYQEFVRIADEVPDFGGDSDNVSWRTEGSQPSELIEEMMECDDRQIAVDVAEILHGEEAWSVHKDGGVAMYDELSDIYEISIPGDGEYHSIWQSFQKSIKHSNRFFNEDATNLLTKILGPIVSGAWPPNSKAVKEIEAAGPDRFIYRGRLANDRDSQIRIHQSPIRELSPPPPHMNTAGRMNAAGIGVFYGSFDKKTCVAELRVPVGGNAVIGKFELLKNMRVLDLTALENAWGSLSYFSQDFVQQHAYGKFIRGFHSEIRKPVIPGRETLDYLSTQFVCEYLWAHAEPAFDGLIFGSSQLSDSANNIVLFPHAITVEGYEDEKRNMSVQLVSSSDEDGEEQGQYVLYEEQPSLPGGWPGSRAATLRLLLDQTVAMHVNSISYDVAGTQIGRIKDPGDLKAF